MMKPRRIIRASLLIAKSTVGVAAVVCKNDQTGGGGQDTGCSSSSPICVDSQNRRPLWNEPGVKCVACVNHYDSPADPDDGCSKSKPLCVTRDDVTGSIHNRPPQGEAGTQCVPYPCHKTTSPRYQNDDEGKDDVTGSDENSVGVDAGCSLIHPVCVDALGNEPPEGRPGVHCVTTAEAAAKSSEMEGNGGSASTEPIAETNDGASHVSFFSWGIAKKNQNLGSGTAFVGNKKQQGCLILATGADPPWRTKADHKAFCGGCPFGISKKCSLQKLAW